MGLKHLKFDKRIVETPGGMLEVRGLSLPDVTVLVRHNKDTLAAIVAQFTPQKPQFPAGEFDEIESSNPFDLSKINTMINTLLDSAPDVAAEIIALAAGDGDAESIEIARNLPFPCQIDALEKIGKLTFDTDGALKKVVETVTRMFEGVAGATKALTKPLSTNGSEPSEVS